MHVLVQDYLQTAELMSAKTQTKKETKRMSGLKNDKAYGSIFDKNIKNNSHLIIIESFRKFVAMFGIVYIRFIIRKNISNFADEN